MARRMIGLTRWRALLALLWSAARWRTVFFGILLFLAGALPTGVLLATGALIHAIPGVVAHGLGPAASDPAIIALAALVIGLTASAACANLVEQQGAVLDAAFALEVHHSVALVTLGTPGVAPLEDPVFADELDAVQDAERRGVLQYPMSNLSQVVTTRLRGLGGFVVLLGFRWWAPLALAVAWQLTNLVYLRAAERGLSSRSPAGSQRLRRSEYLRSLAVEPAAAKEVRVFKLAGWTVAEYGSAWRDALGILWGNRKAERGLNAAAIVALAASHAAVLGALGEGASRGQVSLAALFVFVQAALATVDLGLIGDAQGWTTQTLALSGRVAALRARFRAAGDAPAALLAPAPKALPAGGGAPAGAVAVRFQDVSFTYRGRQEPTLDGLNLEIRAGESLAIVGENGAGKSTLVKLLCGVYEPGAGTITLDGSATPAQARGRIGVIFQDFVRYQMPLRENVAFGHLPLIGDAGGLERALRDAGGGELLDRLPRGWETVLSREFEGGVDLSGGEWQRVALARALAAVRGGAGLLILDEPTAALDVRAETELFERFLELTRDVTTILVSHRLSSVRRADRIVVIDGGRVVEDGSHEQLMRAGGRYAAMFSLQAERFAVALPLDPAADGEEVRDA